MSGKKRRRRRYRNDGDSPGQNDQESKPTAAWYWYAVVIAGALLLFAIFIATQFNPMDQAVMAAASVACAGIAFFIIGSFTAVGNFDFKDHPLPGKFLNSLAAMATPYRRWGEAFYSSDAFYHVFEKLLFVIVIPLGILLSFVRPRQTWPAILWVGGGILAMLVAYTAIVMVSERYY